MARPKGSVNRATLASASYVDRVFALLKSKTGETPESLSLKLLQSENPMVVQKELQILREYKWGRPKESVEHSGELSLVIDMPGPERERT